jgi:hypothetical protein
MMDIRNCPKHVVSFQNKFEKISASSWFYYKDVKEIFDSKD